jgi:hypothetical protein
LSRLVPGKALSAAAPQAFFHKSVLACFFIIAEAHLLFPREMRSELKYEGVLEKNRIFMAVSAA